MRENKNEKRNYRINKKMTLYDAMLTGLFSGIGTGTALTIVELYIKPRIHKLHNKIRSIHKVLKNTKLR